MSNRITKRLEHQKAFRVQIGSGPPRNNEGSDGELALRTTKSGLKLFAKHRNRWYIVGEQSLGILGGRDGDESLQVHNMASGTTINSRTGNLDMGGAIVFGKVNTGVAQKGEAQSKLYAAGSGNVNFDIAGDLTVDVKGGQFTIESSAAGYMDPDLILIGKHDSLLGYATLQLESHRNGTDNNQDNDTLGEIGFYGYNDNGDRTKYAGFFGQSTDVTDGDERGKLYFQVVTNASGGGGSTMGTGLSLDGSLTNSVVDVSIGLGATSMTTIAGDLDIDGDAITSAGNLTITPAGGTMTLTAASASRPNLIVETNDNGTQAGWIAFMHNSDSPAVDDIVGQVRFYGKNDAGTPESNEYGNIKVQIADETDGTGAGAMHLGVLTKDSGGTGDGLQTGFSLQGTDTNDIVDCSIAPQAKLNFDTFGDTYIAETNADEMSIYVGGDCFLKMNEAGTDGNTFLIRGACAGFTRIEATFSATLVIGSGNTHDTDIDFRFSNKYRLEMTADIHTMNLIFPSASGNFTLVCTTNGDHDVSNWKVYESDESAATTTDVMWAGGSVPAFTDSGIDIVTFYWDSTEQQCYGVASLAFATP